MPTKAVLKSPQSVKLSQGISPSLSWPHGLYHDIFTYLSCLLNVPFMTNQILDNFYSYEACPNCIPWHSVPALVVPCLILSRFLSSDSEQWELIGQDHVPTPGHRLLLASVHGVANVGQVQLWLRMSKVVVSWELWCKEVGIPKLSLGHSEKSPKKDLLPFPSFGCFY